jgi:hypothetical protein
MCVCVCMCVSKLISDIRFTDIGITINKLFRHMDLRNSAKCVTVTYFKAFFTFIWKHRWKQRNQLNRIRIRRLPSATGASNPVIYRLHSTYKHSVFYYPWIFYFLLQFNSFPFWEKKRSVGTNKETVTENRYNVHIKERSSLCQCGTSILVSCGTLLCFYTGKLMESSPSSLIGIYSIW